MNGPLMFENLLVSSTYSFNIYVPGVDCPIMAVQAPVKLNVSDDFEEEEGPVIFKRPSSSSKPSQLKAELKKPSSQRLDGQPRINNLNGQNSSPQKSKVVPSSKPSSMKSPAGNSTKPPVANPKASTSSAELSPMRLPKPSASLDIQSRQSKPTNVKEESDSDSEDKKPLISRRLGTSGSGSKGQSLSSLSQPSKKASVQDSSDSSDDDKPISSRILQKFNDGTSACKPCVSTEKKLTSSKIKQNGLASGEDLRESTVMTNKRPLEKIHSSDQSLVKKLKVSDASSALRAKQSVKAESDDDDLIPIAQRMKKPAAAAFGNKSSSVKEKITKVVPTKFKKTSKESKKATKKSKYSTATKVPPGSGDGQKKWTTLEHNGVIFPPPYKPHGVKILYKGKPVDLTPEQEEVSVFFHLLSSSYSNPLPCVYTEFLEG